MIALINLLDNAIKYSPDGGAITVVSELEDLFVHISVSDQGVGIPPEELEHAFECYKRLPSGPTTVEGEWPGTFYCTRDHSTSRRQGLGRKRTRYRIDLPLYIAHRFRVGGRNELLAFITFHCNEGAL